MRILNVMNSLMKKQMFFIILSILLGVCTVMDNIGLLSFSAILISKAALKPYVLDLMVFIVAVRFFGTFRGVFRYFERLISHDTTLKILSSIRQWFYKEFNDNYSENNSKFKTGDIYTKIVNDIDVLKDFFLRVFFPNIIAVITGIATTAIIAFFSMKLSIIYLAFYITAGFLFPIALFKTNKDYAKKERALIKQMNIMLLDALEGINEVIVYGLKNEYTTKFDYINIELLGIKKNKNMISSIADNVIPVILSVLVVVTLYITYPLVINGEMNALFYTMLPLTVMSSFEALIPLSTAIFRFNEAYTSGEDIFSIINNKNASKSIGNERIDGYDISVNNLSVFDGQQKVIEDISFELKKNKKIAIVGPSGSGKSTILRTILGFVPYKGTIKIGNKDYVNIDNDDARKCMTYIDQQPHSFNTTILENLLIANTKTNDNEIAVMLQKMQLTGLIESMPDGLNTTIGQYGYNISGGELKRIMIARALLKDSSIVLLDEPTASLDINIEKKVVENLHILLEEKSVLWVTHRLLDMEWMDEVLVVDKGRIVERGTHKQLMDSQGLYYDLFMTQKQYLGEKSYSLFIDDQQ